MSLDSVRLNKGHLDEESASVVLYYQRCPLFRVGNFKENETNCILVQSIFIFSNIPKFSPYVILPYSEACFFRRVIVQFSLHTECLQKLVWYIHKLTADGAGLIFVTLDWWYAHSCSTA